MTFNSKFYYLGSSIALFFTRMDIITLISSKYFNRFLRVWNFFKLLCIITPWELETSNHKNFCFHSYHCTSREIFSCRLIYESKAANAAVEFTHLRALQTHFRPLKQIMKLLAAIQESFMYLSLNQNQIMTDEYGHLCTSEKVGLILNITYLTLSLHIAFGLTANLRFKSSDIPDYFINAGSATDSLSNLWSSHLYSPCFNYLSIE